MKIEVHQVDGTVSQYYGVTSIHDLKNGRLEIRQEGNYKKRQNLKEVEEIEIATEKIVVINDGR